MIVGGKLYFGAICLDSLKFCPVRITTINGLPEAAKGTKRSRWPPSGPGKMLPHNFSQKCFSSGFSSDVVLVAIEPTSWILSDPSTIMPMLLVHVHNVYNSDKFTFFFYTLVLHPVQSYTLQVTSPLQWLICIIIVDL